MHTWKHTVRSWYLALGSACRNLSSNWDGWEGLPSGNTWCFWGGRGGIFVSRNLDNAPLLGHPYTTRVIKVDKHTKERTRGLAQLSVLVLPIEMPLHLSSPTWVLSKVWAKCKAPEGQERKEAQLHQCNEDISSNTLDHTQNDVLTWHETIWRRLYEIMSVSAWHPSQEPYPISKWHQSLIDSTT